MPKNILTILLSVSVLAACSLMPNYDLAGMFYGQSPRSDERFEQSMEYNDKHASRDVVVATDDYKIYVATDMHVDSTWRNTTSFAVAAQNDDNCAFALIPGDVINAQGNYPHFLEGMRPLNKMWFCTAGNHDIYFGQWKDFLDYIGSSTYFFIVQTPAEKDLIICLDSSDGTLGRKQLHWLRSLLQEKSVEGYRHIIVFTHTHFFKRDDSQGHTSNFALEETYEITDLFARYGVDWCISGHDHSREITDYKGVKYIIVDSLQDKADRPAYMIVSVDTQLNYQFVELINK